MCICSYDMNKFLQNDRYYRAVFKNNKKIYKAFCDFIKSGEKEQVLNNVLASGFYNEIRFEKNGNFYYINVFVDHSGERDIHYRKGYHMF